MRVFEQPGCIHCPVCLQAVEFENVLDRGAWTVTDGCWDKPDPPTVIGCCRDSPSNRCRLAGVRFYYQLQVREVQPVPTGDGATPADDT